MNVRVRTCAFQQFPLPILLPSSSPQVKSKVSSLSVVVYLEAVGKSSAGINIYIYKGIEIFKFLVYHSFSRFENLNVAAFDALDPGDRATILERSLSLCLIGFVEASYRGVNEAKPGPAMIYQTNHHQSPTMSSARRTSPRAQRRNLQASSGKCASAKAKRGDERGAGSEERCRGRCRVQWSEKHVKEGLVLVQEAQLARVVKTGPITEHYEIDPKPFAK